VALGLSAEVDFHLDVAAAMAVNVAVTMDFEDLQREIDIHRSVFVDPVFDAQGFAERLVAFANEDEHIAAGVVDFETDQDLAERFAGSAEKRPRPMAVDVEEMLDKGRLGADDGGRFVTGFHCIYLVSVFADCHLKWRIRRATLGVIAT
jgi:hypothetical protein